MSSLVESSRFPAVFGRLRAILEPYSSRLEVSANTASRYCLQGGCHPTHKRPMPIAWVEIGKNYVSFHHMGVYSCPSLLDGVSARLRARMQGKSCFNFTSVDDELFGELQALTERAFEAFRSAGYMS